jgi:hypothetical protein
MKDPRGFGAIHAPAAPLGGDMADQNRNQQGKRNPNQQSSQQGSEWRENRGDAQQAHGDRVNPDDSFGDDEFEEIGSTDRTGSNREPASIADDRGDRRRQDFDGDRQFDELESDMENDSDMEDVDEEDLGGGGSNR